MDSLPPELLDRICSLLVAQHNGIAKYATISRAWQHTIEDRTFSRLSLVNDEKRMFDSAVLESIHRHRRLAIRRVALSFNLPTYDDYTCGRFEREADRQINNQAFSKALAELFAALQVIDVGGGSRPIELHLRDFYSAMDVGHRDQSGLEENMWTRTRRWDLCELRYRDSYLQLPDIESVPQLSNVASLTVSGNGNRKLAPATIVGLMSRLPNLTTAVCLFCDNERRRPDRRRYLRSQFAEQLSTLAAPERLKNFIFTFVNTHPSNSRFVDADIRGSFYSPHTDDLSTALRLFSKAAPCLTDFVLNGPISVGPSLFEPLHETDPDTEQRWQRLEEFVVKLSPIRPDGGWYIELDSQRATEDPDEDEEEDEGEEDMEDEDYHGYRSEDSSSSFDSNDSFFAGDQLPQDSYSHDCEKRDARLNGDEPYTCPFRTSPTPQLEAMFLAAACAASRMPSLRYMHVSLDIRASGRTGQQSQKLGFEYMTAGVDYPGDGPDVTGFNRLYWDAPRDWRMNKQLQSQWLSLLGKSGIVKYFEW
jgi:hypothetical protein